MLGFKGVLLTSKDGSSCHRKVSCLSFSFCALIFVFVALNLTGCEVMPMKSPQSKVDTPPETIVPATANTTHQPFEEGEVVASNGAVHRKFVGLAGMNGYIVQDFYINTDIPRTNPYVMTRLEEVSSLLLDDVGDPVQQYKMLTESGIGIDGSYVQWYMSGGKAIEGFFSMNLPTGEWQLVYENGKQMLLDTWSHGMRNGESKGWHTDGTIAGEGEYLENLRQGVWTVWYPNGVKMQEGSYNYGQQDGEWVYWYANANIKEKGMYNNGVRQGRWQWWTKDGVLARDGEYDETGTLKGGVMGSGRIQPREPIF